MNQTEMWLNYWAAHYEHFTVASQPSTVKLFRDYGAQAFPKQNPLRNQMRCTETRQYNIPEIKVPEPDWSRVDRVVCALRNTDKAPSRAIVFNHYIFRRPIAEFCRVHKINYRTYNKLLNEGLTWIGRELRKVSRRTA